MNGYDEANWSRFCGGLLGYINDYYSSFVKTNYEIKLNMSIGEIEKELWSSKSMEDFSSELREVAKQYKKTL